MTADQIQAEFGVTPQQARKAADWHAREISRISAQHADLWPQHEDWVRDYLKQELREHVQARVFQPQPKG